MAFDDFLNNENDRRLFVYSRLPRLLLTVSLLPPTHHLTSKLMCFMKLYPSTKLTMDNIGERKLWHKYLISRHIVCTLIIACLLQLLFYNIRCSCLLGLIFLKKCFFRIRQYRSSNSHPIVSREITQPGDQYVIWLNSWNNYLFYFDFTIYVIFIVLWLW